MERLVSRAWAGVITAAVLVGITASAVSPGHASATRQPAAVPAATVPSVVIGAVGDISPAAIGYQRQTAALVARWRPHSVLALGDLQYPSGSLTDFRRYYDPTWGGLKRQTRPVPGNHEYRTPKAAGYVDYFGIQAKPRGHTYYSYNLAAWHMVALNSELTGDQWAGQLSWLRADLAANQRGCVLAYWHKPRFSSGAHGSDPAQAPFWDALYSAKVDVVLNGHDHVYERFYPQTPAGQATTQNGIRQFVVGTGGAEKYRFGATAANSQVRLNQYYGAMRMVLSSTGYQWQYFSVDGRLRDSGGNRCSP